MQKWDFQFIHFLNWVGGAFSPFSYQFSTGGKCQTLTVCCAGVVCWETTAILAQRERAIWPSKSLRVNCEWWTIGFNGIVYMVKWVKLLSFPFSTFSNAQHHLHLTCCSFLLLKTLIFHPPQNRNHSKLHQNAFKTWFFFSHIRFFKAVCCFAFSQWRKDEEKKNVDIIAEEAEKRTSTMSFVVFSRSKGRKKNFPFLWFRMEENIKT